MSADNSLYEALLASELDDKPACTCCLRRPKYWRGRFRHRLWICIGGHAWRTIYGPGSTYLWRRWPA